MNPTDYIKEIIDGFGNPYIIDSIKEIHNDGIHSLMVVTVIETNYTDFSTVPPTVGLKVSYVFATDLHFPERKPVVMSVRDVIHLMHNLLPEERKEIIHRDPFSLLNSSTG